MPERFLGRNAVAAGAAFLAFLVAGRTAPAATWNVTESGTGDAPTLQAAIDSASFGDTVLVHAGTYRDLFFDPEGGFALGRLEDGVVLRSAEGPGMTILDPSSPEESRCLNCFGCGPQTVIEGFTFLGGDAFGGAQVYILGGGPILRDNVFREAYSGLGGAILVEGGAPIITKNVFQSNVACCGPGGALFAFGSSAPVIRENLFVGNQAPIGGAVAVDGSAGVIEENDFEGNLGGDGGALAVQGGSPKIRGNRFYQNEGTAGGGAVAFLGGTTALFAENLIAENRALAGGGLRIEFSSPAIRRNTVVENTAGTGGGISVSGPSAPHIERNVFAWNHDGSAVTCDGTDSSPTFACNDFFENEGLPVDGSCSNPIGTEGNIAEDPLFCPGSYEPQSCSPLLGFPCETIGAFGAGCECQVTSSEQVTWGSLKVMFREAR